jgi:hypothetical protein
MEASKHEEDLFAEALLLQEELGVDLAEHVSIYKVIYDSKFFEFHIMSGLCFKYKWYSVV